MKVELFVLLLCLSLGATVIAVMSLHPVKTPGEVRQRIADAGSHIDPAEPVLDDMDIGVIADHIDGTIASDDRRAWIALSPDLARLNLSPAAAGELSAALATALSQEPEAVLQVLDDRPGSLASVETVCGAKPAAVPQNRLDATRTGTMAAVGRVTLDSLHDKQQSCLEHLGK